MKLTRMMVAGMALAMASYSFAGQVSSDGVRNMTDPRDGKIYKTVKIGKQIWMAENLNYKISSSRCFENNEKNCEKFGRKYKKREAEKVCPDGWRLPSITEYRLAARSFGGEPDGDVKTNWFGLGDFVNAMLGEIEMPRKFCNIGSHDPNVSNSDACFWAFPDADSDNHYDSFFGGSVMTVIYSGYYENNEFLVRCIKDAVGPVSITVKDADGNVYPAMKIGQQIWMAKNMNVNVPGSMCYDNDPANCEKYGRLYTWEAAKKVCPTGWHLPSSEEFETFLETVKVRVDQIVTQKKLNAEPLKKGEDEFYNHLRASSWANGFDTFGFSALPAGDYYSRNEESNGLGYGAYFWSSTEDNEGRADNLGINAPDAYVDYGDKDDGYSVRCLKD